MGHLPHDPGAPRGEAATSRARPSPLALVAESTGTPPEDLRAEDTFEDLGLDSLLMVRLRLRLEEEFGLWLDEVDLNLTTTLAELEHLLQTHGS
ncbi:acyl carrier protein [Actinomadura roseirufa]|uniref:acyl carrier protein n=1 Tax=Actinomadura roseirufa TaxID=2094049 RepID=UPI0010410C16|nr:acyl carrier protein [Actinomadura roseirufa]